MRVRLDYRLEMQALRMRTERSIGEGMGGVLSVCSREKMRFARLSMLRFQFM